MKIGVLSLQGDFSEHLSSIQRHFPDSRIFLVRNKKSLQEFDYLDLFIIPGGESTAFSLIIEFSDLYDDLLKLLNHPKTVVFATCAGIIMLAKQIVNPGRSKSFQLLDIQVEKNSYGRQVDSFIGQAVFTDDIYQYGVNKEKLEQVNKDMIFIRAPKIKSFNPDSVEALIYEKKDPVLIKQGRIVAATFHPELSMESIVYEILKDTIKKIN